MYDFVQVGYLEYSGSDTALCSVEDLPGDDPFPFEIHLVRCSDQYTLIGIFQTGLVRSLAVVRSERMWIFIYNIEFQQ